MCSGSASELSPTSQGDHGGNGGGTRDEGTAK